jgi:hypothetical protein
MLPLAVYQHPPECRFAIHDGHLEITKYGEPVHNYRWSDQYDYEWHPDPIDGLASVNRDIEVTRRGVTITSTAVFSQLCNHTVTIEQDSRGRIKYSLDCGTGRPSVSHYASFLDAYLSNRQIRDLIDDQFLSPVGQLDFMLQAVVERASDPKWTFPDGMDRWVSLMVGWLDSPDWRRRDAARDELVSLGPDGAAYLLCCLDRSRLSPQQQAGINSAITALISRCGFGDR